MLKFFTFLLLITSLCLVYPVKAQSPDRIENIQNRLTALTASQPGLNQTVQLSVTGVSVHDYLNALARTNRLSISVDPKLSFLVNDILNGVTASNILVFLAKTYNLDINVVGSIIYVTPFTDPASLRKPPARIINIGYQQAANTLSMELENDSLGAVARRITAVSGKNVAVPASMRGKRVSGFIADAPFDAALEKLAYTNEFKMSKTNDSFYIFEPLGENEELYINGDKNTSVKKSFRSAATTGGNPGLFIKTVNGVKRVSADAGNAAILDMVRQASQEMGKNYLLYTDIKGSLTIHVTDMLYEDFLNLLFKGTDYTFHSENGIYMIGDSRQEGLRTYKAIKLQNRAIDTVMAMIPTDWKKGVEIKEFREQNTLVISGAISRINEIAAFIAQLDVQVPVVLIEVTLVDIRKNRNIATGISAGVSDSVKTGGSVLPGLDFTFSANSVNRLLNSVGKLTSINLGHVVPNFYVGLKALEANNNVDVRSIPKLSALNGHTATLSIGSKRYYKNTNQTVIPTTATSQSIFSNVYQATEANLAIMIKPVVSGNDQVTLGIKIDISDFISIPTDGSPPPQSISKFETSLRVNSDDMIVLGGIERTEHDDGSSGIPLLSRIPVLKWIFSSRSKTSSKVVTLVFIQSKIQS